MVSGVVPHCRFSAPNCVEGVVVAVDRFGNLMTNIEAATIDTLTSRTANKRMVVEVAGRQIDGIVASYGQVARHAPLALVGSRGLLEISVNCGSAWQMLDAGKNDRIRVRLV
jgi:S-adenosylmethionine hydrolase